ncbi:MAG: zinc ribbon domain-containing protein, partial [Sphaerochaetaceae bacterium]|nr:zinc ribbon domain-containing protein [Sphaerochaetaceae bacterium]
VTKEEFETVQENIKIRNDGCRIERGSHKYQGSYVTRGKIFCPVCNYPLKRSGWYIKGKRVPAFLCTGHHKNKQACTMKAVTAATFENAFVDVMKKLSFAKDAILVPYYSALTSGYTRKTGPLSAEEKRIAEEKAKLTALMERHYINPTQYRTQMLKLEIEERSLRREEKKPSKEKDIAGETKNLMVYLEETRIPDVFDEETFKLFVSKVTLSRTEATFYMKCGLTLKEDIVWQD